MKTYQQNKDGNPWRYFNYRGDQYIEVLDAKLNQVDVLTVYGHGLLLHHRQTGEPYPEELIKERINEYLSEERKR